MTPPSSDQAPTRTELPIHWHDHDVATKGVRERRFDVVRDGRTVPGLIWTSEQAEHPCPLVLVGHGAAQTKSVPYVVALARILVRHHGFAIAAIDGPVHGDRRSDGLLDGGIMFLEFGQRLADDRQVTDDMVADWQAVIDSVQRLAEVDDGAVGYWGLSMGTILGLPLVAAEPRISVAVLGLWGVHGPTAARLAADAANVHCPVMFLVQWDDQLCPRDRAFSLFDALGTDDKRLHANPGAHSAVPPEEFKETAVFLAERLARQSAGQPIA